MQRDTRKKNVSKKAIVSAHIRLINPLASFAQLDQSTRVNNPSRLEAGTYFARVYSPSKELVEEIGTLAAGQVSPAVVARYADGTYNPSREIIYLKQKDGDPAIRLAPGVKSLVRSGYEGRTRGAK